MKTIDELWADVKEFYEKSYNKVFKERLSEIHIHRLYREMNKLGFCLLDFYLNNPILEENYLRYHAKIIAAQPAQEETSPLIQQDS